MSRHLTGIGNHQGNVRGMGPVPDQKSELWHRCRNKFQDCPTYEDSGCCKKTACELCITWVVYGETDRKGELNPIDADTYSGSVAGMAILAKWENRNGECWWVLYVDGVEKAAVRKCNESGFENVSCHDPGYTFEDVEIDYVTGDMVLEVEPRRKLARNEGTPAGECLVAVAVLLDQNWRMDTGFEDMQNGGLAGAVAKLANTDRYSLATIIFNDATRQIWTPFAVNNGTTWLQQIESITTFGGSTLTVDSYRASDLAIDDAINSLVWPVDAVKKTIILLNQGRPSRPPGLPQNGNAYELAQLASAAAAQASGITVHSIQVPFIVSPNNYFDHGVGHESVGRQTAIAGGGSYQSANPDGNAAYNGGVKEIVLAIESLFEGVSCEGGTCATKYCGDTDCTPDKLCITAVRTEPLCRGSDVLEFNAVQGCEIEGWGDPGWDGSVTLVCGDVSLNSTFEVDLDLIEDAYGNCVIYGSAVEYEGHTYGLEETIVSGDTIAATWVLDDKDGYGTITFTVTDATCEDCGGIEVDCCPGVVLPGILYAEFIQVTAGTGEDCSCAEGVYALNNLFLQGSPSEPAGQWTTGLMPWLPCTGGGATQWQITLTCLAGVWTVAVTWYDADDNDIGGGTTNNPTAEACDPLELTFAPSTPGDIVPSGTCTGGLTPALNQVVVSL